MNNYHIYAEIGRGKGSVVYKGREKKTINYVAIKSVEKQFKNKVLNEVAVLYSLLHTNILRFLNWYETSKHIWLILEFCPGGDLLAMLRLDQSMPESACKKFSYDILSGLQFIHSKGYIYGDLKPSNILVNEYGTLLLCDFGLAKKVMQEEDYQKQPEETNKRGSPYYMSPELFYSDGIHSFASDIWAFGCVLYELATGRPPFYSKSLEEVVSQILETEPKPLWTEQLEQEHQQSLKHHPPDPSVPPQPPHFFSCQFQHILTRCLEKDPAKRMTWPELRQHPWWNDFPVRLANLELPDQPVFNRLFMNNSVAPTNILPASSPLRQSISANPTKPDILRLSFQAKKNAIAEVDAAKAAALTNKGDIDRVSSVPASFKQGSPPVTSTAAEIEEIQEDLNGTMSLPNYDTELNFSTRMETEDVPTQLPPSRPSTHASSTAGAASSSSSAANTKRTFREPPRPTQPSELDMMEHQLAQLKAEEEEEEEEEEREEEFREADEEDGGGGHQAAWGAQPDDQENYEQDEDYEEAVALNPHAQAHRQPSGSPSNQYHDYDEADEEAYPDDSEPVDDDSGDHLGEAPSDRQQAPSHSNRPPMASPSTAADQRQPPSSTAFGVARKASAGVSRLPILATRTPTAANSNATTATTLAQRKPLTTPKVASNPTPASSARTHSRAPATPTPSSNSITPSGSPPPATASASRQGGAPTVVRKTSGPQPSTSSGSTSSATPGTASMRNRPMTTNSTASTTNAPPTSSATRSARSQKPSTPTKPSSHHRAATEKTNQTATDSQRLAWQG